MSFFCNSCDEKNGCLKGKQSVAPIGAAKPISNSNILQQDPIGTIVLLGTPQTGKSSLFRQLCKNGAAVDNYERSSISVGVGKIDLNSSCYKVLDLPGITTLSANTYQEMAVRKILQEEKNIIITHVTDSKNLQRALTLNSELSELGLPMVFVLNMMDEALRKGLIINDRELEEKIGIKSVMSIASTGEGTMDIVKAFMSPQIPTHNITYPLYIEFGVNEIQNLPGGTINRLSALQLLEQNSGMHDFVKDQFKPENGKSNLKVILDQAREKDTNIGQDILRQRVLNSIEIESLVVRKLSVKKRSFGESFSDLASHPLFGVPIMLTVFYTLYQFVGSFGAEYLVDLIQVQFFQAIVIPFVDGLLQNVPSTFIYDLFLGTYGLISVGLASSIGVVLPIIATFFFAFSFLEDSGYLARVGILLNSMFKKMGLNGKAIMPLFLGFSCVTMATLSVQALDTRKEKLISILLLWLCIPCSAQIGIFVAILATLSMKAVFTIFGVILMQLILVGYIAGKMIPGEKSDLMMEIHPIRLPNLKHIAIKSYTRVKFFIKDIIPLFLYGSVILVIMDKFKILHYIEKAGEPIISNLMELPAKVTEVFLLGFLRKEAGAAFFITVVDAEQLSEIDIIVSVVVMTLFVPCVSSVLLVVKEYGLKIAVSMMVLVTAYAMIVGIALSKTLRMVF